MASELERAAAAFDEEGLSGEVHVVSLKPVLMRLYGANDQRATGMITSALSQGRRHWTRETFLAWWAEEAAREARGKQRGGGSRDAPRRRWVPPAGDAPAPMADADAMATTATAAAVTAATADAVAARAATDGSAPPPEAAAPPADELALPPAESAAELALARAARLEEAAAALSKECAGVAREAEESTRKMVEGWNADEGAALERVRETGRARERGQAEMLERESASRRVRAKAERDDAHAWAAGMRDRAVAEAGGAAPSVGGVWDQVRAGWARADAAADDALATPPRQPHVNARGQGNGAYPKRQPVADALVEWSATWAEYDPPEWTHAVVIANNCRLKPNGWADPPEVSEAQGELRERKSFEGAVRFDASGAPLNPRGRTGLRGRGLLGKWGANHAADPIVTRFDPASGQLQVVAIQRKDTGAWALPGGMVDPGEAVSATVRREFEEEAGNFESNPETQAQFRALVDALFGDGKVVYRGYVDDPRNTDNAWMETTAFHFHCGPELAPMLPLRAGDDAAHVTWLRVDAGEPRYVNLYASHREWVDSVAAALG